jgi:mannan endo-1,4-beta-mannosidase
MNLVDQCSRFAFGKSARFLGGARNLLCASLFAALAACGGGSVSSVANSSTSTTAGDSVPTVTLTASAASVTSGQTVTLTWSSTNADSCTASGGWNGTEPTSGSASSAALSASTDFTLTCSSSSGSASQTASVALSTSANTPGVTLHASPTSVASGGTSTLTWSTNDVASCTASGGWSGSVATSGSQSTGAITTPTAYTLTCTGSDGSATDSVNVTLSSGAPTTGTASRPSYNTGSGFFVLNGKLYDANGNEFRIRGVDRCHYDSNSQAGIQKSGANTVRMFMGRPSLGAAKFVEVVQTQHIAYNEVPVMTMPEFPDGTATTGNTNASLLAAGVAWWVANASTFTAIDKYLLINIANEWGPSNSQAWATAYEAAIASMRAAGYLGPLVIDSGGWGQNMGDLLDYSTAVFNSDPQKNIIFSLHIYGSIPTASVAPDLAQLAALSKSVGMVFIVGEFGPGRNIGPSPTLTTPGDIITAAEANGIGWMAWAWDDNNLGGGGSNDNWFSMTYKGPGIYTQTSDLTKYGQDVVLNPTYGLQTIATPASVFSN